MISQLKLSICGNLEDVSAQSASIFHGVLMGHVSYEYGERLHQSELKPFQQYVEKKRDSLIWTINTLTDEAYQEIIMPMLLDDFQEIELKHKNLKLKITDKKLQSTSEQELIEKIYLNDCSGYISIDFITPIAFKSEGKYIFYPDIRLIYRSLMKKYDAFADSTKVFDDKTLEQLVNYTEITYYSLRSTTFAVKGSINSFIGTVTFKIHGAQIMKNLVHLLFQYGEFSGIGIKCALGMGAIRIKQRRDRKC